MPPRQQQQDDDENKKFIFTSKNIEEITQQISDGYIVKRYQNPWFKNEVGVRRAGLSFGVSEAEIEEYYKCSEDIHYFAEKYCKIKREDGSVGPIVLRDYQKEILDLFKHNRVILCASRQSGKCANFNTIIQISATKYERLGILYYCVVSLYRKLTFLEKIKIELYNFIYQLDSKHKKFNI